MNNDEKILSLLENISGKVDRLEQGQAELKADVSRLEQGQTKLKADVSGIKILLENEIEPNIRIIAEGHLDITRRLDHIQPIVENLEEDVSVIKVVVSEHSRYIVALRDALQP